MISRMEAKHWWGSLRWVLNQRPLGYEGKMSTNAERRQPIKPNKTLRIALVF
jgi:hypothetical protein